MSEIDFQNGFICGLATKGLTQSGLQAQPQPTAWTPPSDWINIDNAELGNINLLVADITLATYAFVCTSDGGQYQIDWGDGTVIQYDSGATSQHTYAIGTGKPCSRGYTTFKVIISPVTGNLTSFTVARHSLTTDSVYLGILWCVCRATALTTLQEALSRFDYYNYLLEAFKMVDDAPNLLSAYYMFQECYGLISADLRGMSAVTNTEGMFYDCASLIEVDVSNMHSVISAQSMFSYCVSLKNIDITPMWSIEDTSYMFDECRSLRSVKANGAPVSSITNATRMFDFCYSLTDIDVSGMAETAAGPVNVNHMFGRCTTLQKVNISNMAYMTSAAYMFNQNYSLKTVIMNDLYFLNNITNMFYTNCPQIENIQAHNMGLWGGNVDFVLQGVSNLKTVDLSNTKLKRLVIKGTSSVLNNLQTLIFDPTSPFDYSYAPQIDLKYNNLSAEQLNYIFTNYVPTFQGYSGKFIDIAGCPGAATCDRTIATAKGWSFSS